MGQDFFIKESSRYGFYQELKSIQVSKKKRCWLISFHAANKKKGKPIFCNRKQSIEQRAKQTAKASGAVFPKDTKIWNCSEKTSDQVEMHAAYDKIRIAFLKEHAFPLTEVLKKPDK